MFIPVAFVSQLMFYSCIRSDYNRVKCRCSGAISNRVLTGAATIPLIIKVISRWLIHNSYIVYSRPNSTLTTVYFYSIWNTSLEVLHTGPWKWDNKSQFCIFSVTLIYLFFFFFMLCVFLSNYCTLCCLDWNVASTVTTRSIRPQFPHWNCCRVCNMMNNWRWSVCVKVRGLMQPQQLNGSWKIQCCAKQWWRDLRQWRQIYNKMDL